MLYSQLTEKDKNLIEYYITHYSNESNGTRATTLKAPLEYILREWNNSKENLYRAFGNNFIVSRDIEIEHCDDSFFARFRSNPIFEMFLHKLFAIARLGSFPDGAKNSLCFTLPPGFKM
jgi:hypothetical protein